MGTRNRFVGALLAAVVVAGTTGSESQVRSGAADARGGQTPAPVSTQRTVRLPDGRLLVFGTDVREGVAIRDPNSGSLERLRSTLRPRTEQTATVLPDGTVLLIGGRYGDEYADVAEVFDVQSGAVTPFSVEGSIARSLHSATLLSDGRVLVAGGARDGQTAPTEIWDLQAHTTTPMPELFLDRRGHTAALMPDGRVLIAGGLRTDGQVNDTLIALDPLTMVAGPAPTRSDSPPAVTGISPAPDAKDVDASVRPMIRFSDAMSMATLTPDHVRLASAAGELPARVVGTEDGRLAFVWPADRLTPGDTYTLTIDGVRSEQGVSVAPVSIRFTTVSERETVDTGDAEEWVPDADSLVNGWKSGRPRSPWETLAPLIAPEGVTAISGRVLTLDGRPLAGVTLGMDGASPVESDRTGRFLLYTPAAAAGRHVLTIAGATADRGGRRYGFFEYGMTVSVGRTNALPFTIWMPRLDVRHEVSIPVPTTREVVVTTPAIPGLELHIPPNTIIRGVDGKPVDRVGITAIPVDRPPFPLARNVQVPVYFTIQPGGAYVATSGSGPHGAQLIYPNYRHEHANKRMQFFHYDPEERDWYVYGLGTVTTNAMQVVPDAKTRLYEFTGAMINGNNNPGGAGRPPGDCCGDGGDPVNLTTGLFVDEATDLIVPDVIPIRLTRTYRSQDLETRPFGIGTTHQYAIFLWSAQQYQQADIILPDGGRVHYVRTSPGTSYMDAVFVHQETPGAPATPTMFYQSVMTWNGFGWDITLKDGSVYVFGENAPLQAIRDRFGNTVQITYDNNQVGTIRQITSPSGRWIQFSYDDASRVIQAKDNIGRVVSYTYDGAGNLATVTDPEHRVTSYTYDGNHQMLTVKPPNLQGTSTNLVINEYTTAADAPTPPGWVKRQTHADGGVFQFSYTVVNGRSTQTDVTDPRGFVRRVTYNADGYSLSETLALGQTEQQTTTYVRQAGTNFLTSTTDALSRQTTQTYDAKGNLLTVTRLANTSQPVTTVYTYEPTFSQVATITDPLNHTTTFGYDALGRRTTTTDALTHTTTYGYDAAGQVTSVTDPLQHAWVIDYASGAPVKLVDPLNHVTQRFLDGGGRVISQSNPLGQTTRFTYDQVNHVTGVTDPAGATTTYGFDAAGRLATVTDARTNVTAYTFDAFNRVVARTDPLVKTETFAYDLNGNPSERIDRMGQVTRRTYDALNRLSTIQFADGSTLSYTHDAGNRVTAIADSLNGSVTRTFDDLDRLTSETTPLGSVTYTYDAADRRATMTVSGQPTINYGYDAANHLTSITQGTASIAIGYDAADRRTTLTLPNGVVVTSSYDNASQLTGLTYSIGSTTLGTLTYAYDAAGRRIEIGGSWARTALPVAVASATYDAANRITTWADGGFTYDANGHYTGDGFTSYVWDARNQLVALTGSANASFQYDATRRRTAKTVGGQTTQFRYDLTDIAQEMVGGAATANLIGGLAVDEWFVRTDSAGQRALLTDALGSVLAETDASGAIRTEYTYEPFGFPFASGESSGNPLRFTGRESDDASLQFSRARYYHPGVGRFASEDPLPGIVSKPATLNLYAYGYNNPLSFVDPLGTEGQCKPRCARVFFDCVLDGLLPGLSTLVQGALEGGLDLAAVLSFNQALDYAAGRGLSYPYKSSVFREIIERVGIFQGARGFVAPLVLDYYVGKCLVVEYNSYRSGQCVP